VPAPHEPTHVVSTYVGQHRAGAVSAPVTRTAQIAENGPEWIGRGSVRSGDSDELLDGILKLQVPAPRRRAARGRVAAEHARLTIPPRLRGGQELGGQESG